MFLCLFFPLLRWRHRGHLLGISLPVPDGIPDGTCGLGGAASELCDLLQGKGDQLQGESVRRCDPTYNWWGSIKRTQQQL